MPFWQHSGSCICPNSTEFLSKSSKTAACTVTKLIFVRSSWELGPSQTFSSILDACKCLGRDTTRCGAGLFSRRQVMAWPGGVAGHSFTCCLRNHSSSVPPWSALLLHSGFSTVQVVEGAQVSNKHFGLGGRLHLHRDLITLLRPNRELLKV